MVARTKLMTLEEFLALPEEKPYLELIDGEVEQKPVGKIPHSRAQSRLYRQLSEYGEQRGGEAHVELGLKLPATPRDNFRVPDVCYYAEPPTARDYPTVPPLLAAEIRSEGQSLRALRERLAFLRAHGTICTLLVDPEARTVEVHEPGQARTLGAGERIELTSLPGFTIEVSRLFD